MTGDDDMRAAEYVLGTLDAAERTAFEQQLNGDAAARAEVAAWTARLSPLNAVLPAEAPSPEVWPRVLAALPPLRPSFDVIQGGFTASQDVMRRSLKRWRVGAVAAGAIAAALAIVTVDRELKVRAAPGSYVAAVNRGGDQPALLVRVDLATGTVTVRPVSAEAPSDRSLELWYIDAGKAPKSMGVVEKATIRMPIPAELSADKATFAVTVEPKGGSPNGNPTGPVLYSGQLIRE